MASMVHQGYRPLALDLPGFGGSEKLPSRWSFQRVVAAICLELDQRGISEVVVVGLSLGGVIAQQMAVLQPQRVAKLILASTFASLWPDDFQQLKYFLARFFLTIFLNKNAQAQRVAWKVFPKPEQHALRAQLTSQILAADHGSYRGAMLGLATHHLGNRLHGFGKPVLVIGGSADTTVFIDRQRKLHNLIPSSSLVVIDGGGHGISVDSPVEFNHHLLAFLSESKPHDTC